MSTDTVLTLAEAEALAARTLAVVDARATRAPARVIWDGLDADRERVVSDLDGLRDCLRYPDGSVAEQDVRHARRYSDGLRRTAALYGITS